ncbi:MAG: hypothetical protein ACOX37_01125 [Bacillota bacterium]
MAGNEAFWEERRLAREYCRLLEDGGPLGKPGTWRLLWEKRHNPGQILDFMETLAARFAGMAALSLGQTIDKL